MSLRSVSERSPEVLVRAAQHWEARRRAAAAAGDRSPTPTAFTIALSREVGARGTSVARVVGERLGWHVYDHELVELIAQEMRLRTSLLESVDERHVSWLEECLENFTSLPSVSESSYVRHLLETVLSLGAHGECVIVGRGTALVLPPATTLRVRLVAPLEDRIAFIRRQRGLSHEEAARYVEQVDRQRTHFTRDHFQKDPADAVNYDLIVNSGRFTVEECADVIIAGLRRLQARSGAGSV
jgi:cytidylate kinase